MNSFVFVFVFFIGLKSAAPKNERIVGGSPANIEDYPSMVQIEILDGYFWGQRCAGSIINHFNILTAAHCSTNRDFILSIYDFRIRAGSEIRQSGGNLYEVNSILNHPEFIYDGYDEMSLEADISLMKLRSSLIYSNFVRPIAIVAPDFVVPDNAPVVYAGWGAVNTGDSSPEVLHHVNVLTVNREICAESYAQAEYPLQPANVTDKMICAGLPGQGACHGDSGGPLLYDDMLVGVISFGSNDCAIVDYPEVCIKVASYADWIMANGVGRGRVIDCVILLFSLLCLKLCF